MNSIIQLAASALPGERRFIALCGAGLSKDAGIPTAWDVMMDTAKLLYCAEEAGTPDREELEKWFLSSKYSTMTYADVIGRIYTTYPDQQAFLTKLLGGRPIGDAHKLIAKLARRGIIRTVVTTNFDDYIERALVEAGIEVQVISTDEDLLNSEPLIHCKHFRVYKPHGTLGRGALRNTVEDLKKLSGPMESELLRVFSDHGMLVVGYSGADPGMMDVLAQRRRNLYPLFWSTFGDPTPAERIRANINSHILLPAKGAADLLRAFIEIQDRLANMTDAITGGPHISELEESLKNESATVGGLFSDSMLSFQHQLEETRPDISNFANHDDAIFAQIEKIIPISVRFGAVATLAARYQSEAAAKAIYKHFGNISRLCTVPEGHKGVWRDEDFDGFKFARYEMFVVFVALIMKYELWKLLGELLTEGLYIESINHEEYKSFSALTLLPLRSLDVIRIARLKLNFRSFTNHLVHEHLTETDLSLVLAEREFMSADYFLYLRCALEETEESPNGKIDLRGKWVPWSCLFLKRPPTYLVRAQSATFLGVLAKACGVSQDVLKSKLVLRARQYLDFFPSNWWLNEFDTSGLNDLGVKP